MKYKTAMAAVFGKYRSPRTRTHAVSLLERYSAPGRPVTAWHALGEDAGAARLLLETLGFEEGTHFTVQKSTLDPELTRFSWTDAGIGLIGTMARELSRWSGDVAQHRVLVPNTGDPLDAIPDVETPAENVGVLVSTGPGLVSNILKLTAQVATDIADLADSAKDLLEPGVASDVLVWATCELGSDDLDKTPVAPLAVLEALARMRGDVEGMPAFQVFDTDDVASAVFGWQASRPMGFNEEMPVAGRVNLMPLCEQKGSLGQLDGYLAWNARNWRKFPEHVGDVVWTQFDARIRPTVDALQFALDGERMRKFVIRLLEAGYPGYGAILVSTTRLAVGNTACGGTPGCEDLSDDDGETSPMQYRIEDSAFPYEAPVYMGAHILAPAGRVKVLDTPWTSATKTRPASLSSGDPDKDAGEAGFRTDEIADEWFAIVHGGFTSGWSHSQHTWDASDRRRAEMRQNLSRFREAFKPSKTDAGRLLGSCSPDNPEFNRRSSDEGFTLPGTFVNGIAAAMRKYCERSLAFVEASPYHPDKIIAGVWSGIATDLAPTSVDKAAAERVFPRFAGLPFDAYADIPAAKANMDAFVKLMRDDPFVQLRFGKRTAGVHRRHMIVVETNVAAKPFIEGLAACDTACQEFRRGLMRAFYTPFVTWRAEPLAAVDSSFPNFGSSSCALGGMLDWVRLDCRKWADQVALARFTVAEMERMLSIGWREDSLGRLILVFATEAPDLALRVKVAWRYGSMLPVPSAPYLAQNGGLDTVVAFTPGMSGTDRYRAVLRAAMRQPGFMSECDTTQFACGTLGAAWIRGEVWGLDSDELPPRDWYLCGCNRSVAIGAYAAPKDLPF